MGVGMGIGLPDGRGEWVRLLSDGILSDPLFPSRGAAVRRGGRQRESGRWEERGVKSVLKKKKKKVCEGSALSSGAVGIWIGV
jgi:hypothetical protein